MRLDIVSDTICPWCYVGKKRLEEGIALLRAKGVTTEISIRWRPFFLDAHLPKRLNKLQHYKDKFGAARIARMVPYMQEVGKSCGIHFSYGGEIGNTLDSHRLIEHAFKIGGQDKQDAVVNALFRRYFEQEKNMADHDVLKSAAEEAGLGDVSAFLAGDELREEVVAEERAFRRKFDVSGVPFFIFNDGEFTLSGAQEAATFVRVVEELSKRESAPATAAGASGAGGAL